MRGLVFTIVCLVGLGAWATEHDTVTVEHNMLEAFHHGHLKGQIRDYTMMTVNAGSGADFYTQAIGASLHYETAEFYGFSMGLKGMFIHRVFSNDISTARFERQLYDLENPSNYNELDRLEELYFNYHYKFMNLRFGKMEVKSPIVNKHDGRMKPKMFSGISSSFTVKKKHELSFYHISKATPRSTVEWFNLHEAIGIYNNGYDEHGHKLHYHGHLDTKFLTMAGYKGKLAKGTKIEFWDYYFDNLMNTAQLNVSQEIAEHYTAKFMYLNQFSTQTRANTYNEEYFKSGELTHVFSAQLAGEFNSFELDLMASYIPEGGQYIFPRELGVDPFYTSITRNWLEGLADASAVGLTLKKELCNWDMKMSYVHLESSNDFDNNRYMELSNDQVNIDITRHFHHALEGLDVRFLYVMKHTGGSIPDYANVVNRTNYHHLNLIMNFNF
ncbi:hypothetical protein SAMN05216474_1071 [Lishizhenia tianjinensis]|uniref:Outer membrane porin, OprD family n=1 Tax=Lishizhenia tianjinensis TaxID=477690 RepID=A0A1I6YPW3_9FLAO|nr:hypothetical protein [Lishizhenia tianjinensis]SFT52388.1 hypothetical protein SAMN05216474_1071 [Lishizhenia tianjinensis]